VTDIPTTDATLPAHRHWESSYDAAWAIGEEHGVPWHWLRDLAFLVANEAAVDLAGTADGDEPANHWWRPGWRFD
jgi:hypothetical protein